MTVMPGHAHVILADWTRDDRTNPLLDSRVHAGFSAIFLRDQRHAAKLSPSLYHREGTAFVAMTRVFASLRSRGEAAAGASSTARPPREFSFHMISPYVFL